MFRPFIAKFSIFVMCIFYYVNQKSWHFHVFSNFFIEQSIAFLLMPSFVIFGVFLGPCSQFPSWATGVPTDP